MAFTGLDGTMNAAEDVQNDCTVYSLGEKLQHSRGKGDSQEDTTLIRSMLSMQTVRIRDRTLQSPQSLQSMDNPTELQS